MKRNRPKKLSEKLLYLYQDAEPEKKMENLTLTERYLLCLNLR